MAKGGAPVNLMKIEAHDTATIAMNKRKTFLANQASFLPLGLVGWSSANANVPRWKNEHDQSKIA